VPHASPAVLDFLATRRSSSAMKLATPGPSPDEIDALIRLATRVPDHGKLAPWRFVILEGAGKARFTQDLDDMATARGDAVAVAKLGKLKAPPVAIVVISSPKPAKVPEWEQRLSAGAVCTTLLYAALATGYGANWITDWYSYDPQACARLGVTGEEKVAGFVFLGTPVEPPFERERPEPAALVTRWQP
jgi:nitroreductase